MPHRLFIAVDLPEAARRRLARLVADAPAGVRPVAAAQLHLTLHFLGDTDDVTLAAIAAALPRVARPPFALDLVGTGVFPPRGRPAVLWAGVAANEALRALHADVAAVLAGCGVATETRPWQPHVTLARLAAHVPRDWTAAFLDRTQAFALRGIQVTQVRLYESLRTPDGAVHAPAVTVSLPRGDRVIPRPGESR